MLRYIVLILLILIVILTLVNLILNKFLKAFSLFQPQNKKKDNEILYKDEDIIVLKGESKKEERKEDE